jgi:hypothetical protein
MVFLRMVEGSRNQGGRLERLSRRLAGQLLGGQAAQLVVNQRQQLAAGVRVAAFDGFQDARDLIHTAPSYPLGAGPQGKTGRDCGRAPQSLQ